MTDRQARAIAVRIMLAYAKRLAFDANLCDRSLLVNDHTQAASRERKQIAEAVTKLNGK
jgi:hypothetical protein